MTTATSVSLRSLSPMDTYRIRIMSSVRKEIEYILNGNSVKVSFSSIVLRIVTPIPVKAVIIR